MILQALYDLARVEGLIEDPDYEYRPVAWAVRLQADGSLIGIEDLRTNLNAGTNRKPRYQGKSEPIPRQPGRTSGDRAFFLVDKAEYALGIDPSDARPAAKLTARTALFREQVESCASATAEPDIVALAKFLTALASDKSKVGLSPETTASDLFAFRVGQNEYVHLRPAVREYWKRQRAKVSSPSDHAFQCIVTGEPIADVGLFPMIRRVPGGTQSGNALVSHNVRAFESYGLAGNENAPVSRPAAEAAACALNRLLDPNPVDGHGEKLPRRHIRLSADTVVVYWSPAREAQAALDALTALAEADDPQQIGEAYRSIWTGGFRGVDRPEAFYAMTLSGTQGRVIVRDWFESTVSSVLANLAQHFADLSIVRNTRPAKGKDLPPTLALRALLDSLAAPGQSDQIPSTLAADVVHAALHGGPYPLGLLQRALLRQRAEAGNDEWIDEVRRDARAALIRAVLLRQRRQRTELADQIPEIDMSLNPTIDQPGYVLGCMMAILERLQQIAIESANATVVDRCFSAASASPRAVMVRLLKNARHHVQKMRDDADQGSTVFLLDRLLNEFCDRFDVDRRRYPYAAEGIPPHLDLIQQGLFVLGYHQMRKWLWLSRAERIVWQDAHPDAPAAFRWTPGEPASAPACGSK